jgi:hypothetical protein
MKVINKMPENLLLVKHFTYNNKEHTYTILLVYTRSYNNYNEGYITSDRPQIIELKKQLGYI